MYNMHKESRSGNKKNEQFYERRELFSKNKLIKKVKKKSSGEKIIVKIACKQKVKAKLKNIENFIQVENLVSK